MREDIAAVVDKAIAERVFPGCVVGVVRANGDRMVIPFGSLSSGGAPVSESTVYDVASVTKAMPLAALALTMIDGGTLSLDKPVATYLPELKNHFDATISDLLRYRVRGVRLSSLSGERPEKIMQAIFRNGFSGPPAESSYTNLPAFLLGLIVERVGGSPLDALAKETFFEPLNMRDTTFFPARDGLDIERIAPTEIDDARGEVRGLPHDESAYAFASAGVAVGHAGLFATMPDTLNFLEAILRDPSYIAIRSGAELGLGWQTDASFFMGLRAGPRTFGKTGYTGTCIAVDVRTGVAFAVYSNRTYPKRPLDAHSPTSAMNRVRSAIGDIVLSSR